MSRACRARALWRRFVVPVSLVVLSACDSMGPPTYATAPGRELLNRIDLHERARWASAMVEVVGTHPAFLSRIGTRVLLEPSLEPGQAQALMAAQVPLVAAAGLPRVADAHVRAWWRVQAVRWRYLPFEHCVALESGKPLPDIAEQIQLTELQFSDDVYAGYVNAMGAAAWAELSRTSSVEPVSAAQEDAAFRVVSEQLAGRLAPEERAVMDQWMRQGGGVDAVTWCRHGRRFHDIAERLPPPQQAIVMRLHLGRYLARRTPYAAAPSDRGPTAAPGELT